MPSLAPVMRRLLLWLKAMQLMATGLGEMGSEHWKYKGADEMKLDIL